MEDKIYIADRQYRNQKVKEIAKRHGTTVKRIQKLYFRHLAGRPLLDERQAQEKPETVEQKDFAWAIDTFTIQQKKCHYELPMTSCYYPDIQMRMVI